MCGIAGFISLTAIRERSIWAARRMADALTHRGPDDAGIWFDLQAGVVLAHRRLAILELSPAGHQPMVSACGRFVLALNGEIYNHAQLRRGVERNGTQRVPWRGRSDTETLLAAISAWGVEAALARCVGMFALAVWDRAERRLTLARDRLGEKPLYYGLQHGVLLFGSELKALRAHPAFDAGIDRAALALFLRYNCVPAPYTIYTGIRKLPPGSLLHVTTHGIAAAKLEPAAYWSLRDVVAEGGGREFPASAEEAAEALDRMLREAIAAQMAADVPLGAFLSGGIDSSTVAALMQAQSARPVKTFTIGFHETSYNEAEHARAVARHLGTEHTELYVTPRQAMEAIPRLPVIYDEPFADASQIPMLLLSQLARRHVTVCLSGDGGDELFAGYNRYFWARRVSRAAACMPQRLRAAAADWLVRLPPERWDRIGACANALLPPRWRYSGFGDKVHKLAELARAGSPKEIYRTFVSHWKDPARVVIGGREPPTLLEDGGSWSLAPEFEQTMMYLDTLTYLPDDILVKVDRAAMAVSLETRAPFLDHRVVEFAARLPLALKIRAGENKWLLRRVLDRYVPRRLVERAKSGFAVPLDAWLRGPLRDWGEALLDERRLRAEGFFRPGAIRERWHEHLSGRRNWQYCLWGVLMFQAWLEHQAGAARASRPAARMRGTAP
ncbi:MAG TPA: asparagine synthase (glutamine-hydrolyzing) [Burkholderiales bacterium]